MNLGFTEILMILAVALILFGAGRLPEVARSFGQAIKEFKKSMKEVTRDDDAETKVVKLEKKAGQDS